MPSFRRHMARVLERLSGAYVIHPSEAYQLPERLHLRKFFDYYGVDCVFDVGANQGQYASMIRDLVGFKGQIISFEPIPELASALAGPATADGNWYVENLALDREAGPAIFNIMSESVFSSLHSPASDQPNIFSTQNAVSRQVEIVRSTLALELPRWRQKLKFKRPFLKMDTQGNDLAIVQGAGSEINTFVGLQSELAIKNLYAGAVGYQDTLEAYSNMGFELSAMVANTAGHFPDLVEMDCIMYRRGAKPVRR